MKASKENLKVKALVALFTLFLCIYSGSGLGFFILFGMEEHQLNNSWVIRAKYLISYIVALIVIVNNKSFVYKKKYVAFVTVVYILVALSFIKISHGGARSLIPYVSLIATVSLTLGMALVKKDLALKAVICFFWTITVVQTIFIILWPDIAFHQDPEHFGRLRGSWLHKNSLGSVYLWTSLIVLYLKIIVLGRPYFLRKYLPYFFICTFVLLYAGSATSLVAFWLSVFVCLTPERFISKLFYCFFLISASISALTIYFFPQILLPILQVLGRSGTFTGRTVIWDGVKEAIIDEWLFGYGYKGFWMFYADAYFTHEWILIFSQAHNVFLEIFLIYGLVLGGLVFLLLLGYLIFNINSIQQGRIAYSVSIAFVLFGLFESTLVQHNHMASFSFWYVLSILPSARPPSD